jgi:hypothetical protein
VDTNAVAQFIEHHATTDQDDDEPLRTATDTLISAFGEWAEMNEIELEDLGSDIPESNRKGNLTQILNRDFGIEKSRARSDDDLIYVYQPISVDEDIIDII